MIERCITNKTEPFELKIDNLIQFNKTDVDKFNRIAEQISNETGVPQELIYKAPFLFFIDHWHKINDEWYFYKSDGSEFHFINELLGEVISEFFGLDTVHYSVAKVYKNGGEEYGLVSKNFCKKSEVYKRAWDYGLVPKGDLSILKTIQAICKSEKEYFNLSDDLKKFFLRDFYTAQQDRSGNNFLLKETTNGIRLAPLYDYENSFETMELQLYKNQIATINITDRETQNLFRCDKTIQALLHLIMGIDMASFIKKVENRHKIVVPTKEKEYYKKHDGEIKRLIKQNKLIK